MKPPFWAAAGVNAGSDAGPATVPGKFDIRKIRSEAGVT
jgi:hypothetical protein